MAGERGAGTAERAARRDVPLRVLVVDDATDLRARVEVMTICEGADVIAAAADGEAAVQLCIEHRPDLVIMDLRMPRGSGVDALERMASLDPAPIVAIFTNYDYESYRSRCTELGAAHFLVKWRDFERLREIVGDLAAA